MRFLRKATSLALAAGVVIATPALAHPKLVSSQPAARSQVAATNRVALNFSEQLMPQMSGMDITMTGMPGMPNHTMKMTGFRTTVEGGKTLVATFARPLMAGTYRVQWHAVSADTHRIQGTIDFTVR
jgi:methionine-rich copper-binding protein CopC